MEAGVTDRVSGIKEIVDLLDAERARMDTTGGNFYDVLTLMIHISSHRADEIYHVANIVLSIGAVLTLTGTIAAIWSSGIRGRYADERISTNEAQTANATRDAANANRLVAEANRQAAMAEQHAAEANAVAEQEKLARVRIEERLAGWKIGPAGEARLVAELKPFAGTQFRFFTDPQSSGFLDTMEKILSEAGWVRKPPSNPLTIANKSEVILKSGIFVDAFNGNKSLLPPMEALVKGLIAEGIPAQRHFFDHNGETDTLTIIIGSRD
jgi:hypothetical protein